MSNAVANAFSKVAAPVLVTVVLAAAWLLGAEAHASEKASGAAATVYAEKTDQQLTELSANWDALNDAERRALLTEVKLRMARNKGRDGVLRIRSERRYGRIIRKSDGSVIRIEAKVVRVRPAPRGEQQFGVGFEQRHADRGADRQEGPTEPPQAPPVVTVKDPAP